MANPNSITHPAFIFSSLSFKTLEVNSYIFNTKNVISATRSLSIKTKDMSSGIIGDVVFIVKKPPFPINMFKDDIMF